MPEWPDHRKLSRISVYPLVRAVCGLLQSAKVVYSPLPNGKKREFRLQVLWRLYSTRSTGGITL